MTCVRAFLFAAAATAAIIGCAPPAAKPVDTSADVAALKKMQDRELVAVSSGNVDTALTPYAADIVMMPPGEPAITGTDALRKWFEAFYKDASASGEYTSADVQVAGDWAVVRYAANLTFTPKKGGKSTTDKIKGIHIFRRQADGGWKIAQDTWNSDGAPPPEPAKKK